MHAAQFDFDNPDEIRTFANGRADVINTDSGPVSRMVLRPGWKWSNDVQPIAGTDWCEVPHFQYHLSGRIHIHMSDGSDIEVGPGQFSSVHPGHDAWVVGLEDVVVVDFGGAGTFAKPPSAR